MGVGAKSLCYEGVWVLSKIKVLTKKIKVLTKIKVLPPQLPQTFELVDPHVHAFSFESEVITQCKVTCLF